MPESPGTTVVAFSKKELEAAEDARLALYAARSRNAARRYETAGEGRSYDYRTEFQRDRDRIIHSRAFRRLKHKTQVFIPFEGDHYRTRLTHTLEVTQVARTIARALGLNEDLTEACALGHDLGHTPFGHSGENVLNRILAGGEPALPLEPKVAAQAGAFKHNYQSVRVVDVLEKRYEHPGLNLTNDTREGILKHTTWKRDFNFPDLDGEGLNLSSGCHLEGQAVGWADEFAQQAHDLEDGLRLVSLERVLALPIARTVVEALGDGFSKASDPAVKRAMLIRGLIHLLVTDLITASRAAIERWLSERKIATAAEFAAHRRKLPGSLVAPSRTGDRFYRELKDFIYQHIIHSHLVSQHDGRAQLVLTTLFTSYYRNPRLLPDSVLQRYRDLAGVAFLRDIPLKRLEAEIVANYHRRPLFLRSIADHLAGMTDSYALAEYDSMVSAYPRGRPGSPD
ncbi:MAG TPA: dNTP triphosphohydrolase [Thermoanaerobaculia bacterium]|nr:dNTP triphosphohydrolase [Thermoanaerobaculia bacterium]